MSHFWGAIKSDESTKRFGAIWMGVFVSLLIGVPIILVTNYYDINVPKWIGVIFIIIIFPIVTYITYKSKSNKKLKK